jgi:hypothetical protein
VGGRDDEMKQSFKISKVFKVSEFQSFKVSKTPVGTLTLWQGCPQWMANLDSEL